MPITFYNECEALQIPSGANGADGLSAVSEVKDFPTSIPQIDPANLYTSGSLFASAVGVYGYEWLKVGVFFTLPGYGVYEIVQEGTATATEKLIYYKNRGASVNAAQGTPVPASTLIVPAGPQGGNGTNGATVLNGILAPTGGQGNNGDFFINTATSTIYGPKAAGAWPAGVSLVGNTGAQGPAGGAQLSLVPSAPTAKGTLASTPTLTHNTYVSLFSSTTGINIPAATLALYDKAVITYQGRITCNQLQVNPTGNGAYITHFIDFIQDPLGANTVTSLSNPASNYIIPPNNNGSIFENIFLYKPNVGVANDTSKLSALFYKMVIEISRTDVSLATADGYRISAHYSCWGRGVDPNGYSAINYLTLVGTTTITGWAQDDIRVVPYIFRFSDPGTTGFPVDSSNMANVEFFKVI